MMQKASTKVQRQQAWKRFEALKESRRFRNFLISAVISAVATVGIMMFAPLFFTGIGGMIVAEGTRTIVGASVFAAASAATANSLLDIHNFRKELGPDVAFLLEVEVILQNLTEVNKIAHLILYSKRDCLMDIARFTQDWSAAYNLVIKDHCYEPNVQTNNLASAFIFLTDELATSQEFHTQVKALIDAGVTMMMQGKMSPMVKQKLADGTQGRVKGLYPDVCALLIQMASSPLFTGYLTNLYEKELVSGTKQVIREAMGDSEYALLLDKEEKTAIGEAKANLQSAIHSHKMNPNATNVAIVGWVNQGKSSLINGLFGEKVAKFGHGQVTSEVTPFGIGKIQFWDHPGIGASFEPLQSLGDYVKRRNLLAYDKVVFVIDAIIEDPMLLILDELSAYRIKVIIVRSHIDQNIDDEEEKSAEEVCHDVRQEIVSGLGRLKVPIMNPEIYLVNCKKNKEYDFPALKTALSS